MSFLTPENICAVEYILLALLEGEGANFNFKRGTKRTWKPRAANPVSFLQL
jgi:hypothetical protein